MLNPLISIVIPVYNTKIIYLAKCFDSITNQSFADFEVLVVDSSTDSSTSLFVNSYLKTDNRFRLLHCDRGVSKQRNLGIDNSKGKYIAFVDSDDRISSNYLEMLLCTLISSKSDIAYPKLIKERYKDNIVIGTETIICQPLVKKIDKYCFFENTPENGLVNPVKLYRKDLINQVRFDEQLSYGEDMMFNYELSKKGFFAVYCENALYYFSADTTINSANKRLNKSSLNIISRLYSLYKTQVKDNNKINLSGILYQYNYCFEIFFRACVLNHKTKYLFWLLKFRIFYLTHNKTNIKQRFYILFPYLRALLKKIIGSKEE